MENKIEIQPGDLFATPAKGWQKWVCRITGAKTWHWGMFVCPNRVGWTITESINKGVSITRFKERAVYIYRIKNLPELKLETIINAIALWGEARYDWDALFRTAIWWLCKYYFHRILHVEHDKAFNCQEWVDILANALGGDIIPDDEYPFSKNLEKSKYLEYIGEYNGMR